MYHSVLSNKILTIGQYLIKIKTKVTKKPWRLLLLIQYDQQYDSIT